MLAGIVAAVFVIGVCVFAFALCNIAADDKEDDRDEW